MNDTTVESSGAMVKFSLMPPKFRLHRDIIFSLEDLFLLPLGLDIAILGIAAYYITRLKKPDQENVSNIFGPVPGTKESLLYPDKIVKCIAHRGAGLDAPENSMEAFKY
ncbi:jg20102, partial [Pararge aegeria aegeria]